MASKTITTQVFQPKDDFLAALEQGVRDVLGDKKAKPHERIAAINAGTKVAMIKHRITDTDESNFFGK